MSVRHYVLQKNKKGEIRLKKENENYRLYTKEIYRGDKTDFYEILQDYKEKIDGWIDSDLYSIGTGYLLEVKEYIECCEDSLFIDYDGHGDMLDENYEFIRTTIPSRRKMITEDVKYVMWYNK